MTLRKRINELYAHHTGQSASLIGRVICKDSHGRIALAVLYTPLIEALFKLFYLDQAPADHAFAKFMLCACASSQLVVSVYSGCDSAAV